jgi:hypothetical protein
MGLLLGAAPAMAADIDFSKSDPEAVALSQKAWASSIDEAKENGSDSTIQAIKVDLNGDGKFEVVGQLKSAYICGGAGPCFFVMTDQPGGYDVLFSVPGVQNAELLSSKTRGWTDIQLNDDKKYTYNGSTYKSD